MKIGILITGHPPEELAANGRYDAYFRRLLGETTFTYEAWSVVDGEMPASVDAADGWLITGSKHGAYEDHPWIPPLEDFIRVCWSAKRPMIGVCFGHQIIAQAMGGTVEKFSKGWSVGAVDYTIDGETYAINAWHQDQVVQKPETAQVIGSSDFCANAVLAYDDTFWTIQPHPEYDHDFIDGLLTYRGKGVVPDPLLDAAKIKLNTALDSAKVAAQMTQFFKKERA
ncbi:Glutamine amidotransferase class I-like protein [Sulfitobacter noctilucae]|uniref:type 1 glutamine amidotransferase n=1 Tax=Sulfitobacter noctilucae TaxID=1342302 RepID=UPI0004688BCE|nr:type 1 glutamine amidotransferase [Sulfitobacter noctilucae]KIN61635.1 Glutamine amidotransferase class I-like protein [Sulfitobacter noctilucae]